MDSGTRYCSEIYGAELPQQHRLGLILHDLPEIGYQFIWLIEADQGATHHWVIEQVPSAATNGSLCNFRLAETTPCEFYLSWALQFTPQQSLTFIPTMAYKNSACNCPNITTPKFLTSKITETHSRKGRGEEI